MGRGLGCIDMHLLASAILTRVPIWPLYKKLVSIFLDRSFPFFVYLAHQNTQNYLK
jgi:hypothetical protein